MIKVVGNREILEIIAIFVIVMTVGILIAIAAVRTQSVSILSNTLQDPRFADLSYALDATLVFIIALLVLRRHSHHSNTILFEALEGIVISFTSFFMFLLLFAILLPQTVTTGYIYVYAAVMAIMLVIFKDRFHKLSDLATVLSAVGVGLILGFNFAFNYAILIFAAVAVYDYIGVFKSNEMINLAKAFSSSNVSFLISVSDLEAVPEWGLSHKEIEDYMNYLSSIHELNDPKFKKILQSGKLPVICQLALGEGDLSLPLMVAVSACVSISHAFAGVVVIGAVAGIFLTMLLLKEYKHPIPAIPPLFSTVGIVSGIAFLVIHATGTSHLGNVSGTYQLGILMIAVSSLMMLTDIVTIARRMHRNRLQKEANIRRDIKSAAI